MGDGELDRIDAGEIGCVERMLPPGPGLGFLAEHGGKRIDHRIERGHGMDPAPPRLALELAADVAVDQSEKDQARPPLDIVEHPVEMAFGADHRPEMAEDVDTVELGQAGLGDHLQTSRRWSPKADGDGAGSMWKTLPVDNFVEIASGTLGTLSRKALLPAILDWSTV